MKCCFTILYIRANIANSVIYLRGFDTMILCFCLTDACHGILEVFFAKHTNWSNKATRILKRDLNLTSSLLEINFPTFLIYPPNS